MSDVMTRKRCKEKWDKAFDKLYKYMNSQMVTGEWLLIDPCGFCAYDREGVKYTMQPDPYEMEYRDSGIPKQKTVPPMPKCEPPKIEKTRFSQHDKEELRLLAGVLIGMSDLIKEGTVNPTLKHISKTLLDIIKESEEA